MRHGVGFGARAAFAVVGLVVVAGLVFGCAAKEKKRPAQEKVATNGAAIVASIDPASFAVYAEKSVALDSKVKVTGGAIGVRSASNDVLVDGAELAVTNNASALVAVYAHGVLLQHSTVGEVHTNALIEKAEPTHGAVTSFDAASMPALPAAGAVSPDSGAFSVAKGTTVVVGAGAKGDVTLEEGATLRVSGGQYSFASLTLKPKARLEAAGASEVRIAGRLEAASNSFFGPTQGSGMTAKGLRIEVGAQNKSGKLGGTPAACAFGPNNTVRALVLVSNGTLDLGQGSASQGVLFGQAVRLEENASVVFEDGFGAATCPGSCDDGNACTIDSCKSGTCAHDAAPNGASCSDNNACTQQDSCQAGACVGSNTVQCTAQDQCHAVGTCDPATGTCSSPPKPDGASCDDANACTQTDACAAGVCEGSNSITCSAQDQCHDAGTCDTATGICSNPPKPNGAACSDGNSCTASDVCGGGACTAGSPVPVDDNNPCTTDGCDPSKGVVHLPLPSGASCSDGNICNGNETCNGAGTCQAGAPPPLSDGNACTVDTCDATGIHHTALPAGTSCTDGNACNGSETCSAAGLCQPGMPPNLNDNNTCTLDACDPVAGVTHTPLPAGTSCTDGNACNGSETCSAAGTCQPGTPPVVDDGNLCTADNCNPLQGVTHTPLPGAPCSDGNACNGLEICDAAGLTCQPGQPLVISDNNPCTTDACDPKIGVVSHTPVTAGTSCSDGNACNGAETCTAVGNCAPGSPPSLEDNNPCTTDACDPASGVTHTPVTAGTTCSDGNSCNGSESCDAAGACQSGTPPSLDDNNPCTTDSCDAGGIHHTPLPMGTTCDDGSACTTNDACNAASICAGTPKPTDDNNACTTDACDAATGTVGHAPTAAGTSCADANQCNGAETCDGSGACQSSTPLSTDDNNPCTSDSCDPATGVHHTPLSAGTSCNDGSVCTTGDVCDGAGSCTGTAVATDDNNACTLDACDPMEGVSHAPQAGKACSTGNACTTGDTCDAAGVCQLGSSVNTDDGNSCTKDSCDALTGIHHDPVAMGSACDDQSVCTSGDTCNGAGQCAGTAVSTDDNNACTIDSCDPVGGVSHTPASAGTSCADANLCNGTETCDGAGACAAGMPLVIDDGNTCTKDGCVPATGATHTPLPGTDCGSNMACSVAGACLPIPPDPTLVAPPVDRTVATTIHAASKFLYSGASPIQSDVAVDAVVPKRAAVLRGSVVQRSDGAPVVGAAVSVRGHSELGSTLTRADGAFDLVVNGGGLLDLSFDKPGYLPAQRRVNVPWQDYVALEPVALVPLDGQVTNISFSNPIEVATGNAVTDASGTRTPRILFAGGTAATMILRDGSTQALSSLDMRLTEYSVGVRGLQAMPEVLPPTSAYTYAVELSADQALAADAKRIDLDKPAYFYVTNFLSLPAGSAVPVGSFDRELGAWVPVNNGLVIKVLDVAGGVATLDIDGTGNPASAAALEALGFTNAERAKVAEFALIGDTFWRVGIKHLSSYDCNLSPKPPKDAEDPDPDNNNCIMATPCSPDGPKGGDDKKHQCKKSGASEIQIGAQTLKESVPIAGTPFSLNYASNRAQGRTAAYSLPIVLSRATVPPSLKAITLKIVIAGKVFTQTFPAAANTSYVYDWDGTDAYGRPVQGAQPADVEIGYVYAGYYPPPPSVANGFGSYSPQADVALIPSREDVVLTQSWRLEVGPWTERESGLGGWSLSGHHAYDPRSGTLYLGSGDRRSTGVIGPSIETTAGNGTVFVKLPPLAGTPANLAVGLPWSIASSPDGRIYFADNFTDFVFRIEDDNTLTKIAGDGIFHTFNGDEQPATVAGLCNVKSIDLDANGNVYIADNCSYRIRKVTTDGIIHTIAGNGTYGEPVSGSAALATSVAPYRLAVAPDGTVFFTQVASGPTEEGGRRIWRLGLDGNIILAAGTGVIPPDKNDTQDGTPALAANLSDIRDVAVGPDGSLYFIDGFYNRVRRITPGGIIKTVAGTGNPTFNIANLALGDGGPATQADLDNLGGIAVGADGTVFIAERWGVGPDGPGSDYGGRIRAVRADGTIYTIAGRGVKAYAGDSGPAAAGELRPDDVAVHPDGRLLIATSFDSRIRALKPAFAPYSGASFKIPSDDGSEVYLFDQVGRHLSTRSAVTGATLLSFNYDAMGFLASVVDVSGNTTTVVRDAAGSPTKLVGPFGQETALTLDAHGYLASVTNPAAESHEFTYTASGLMLSHENARGFTSSYSYDGKGRLATDVDPIPATIDLVIAKQSSGDTTTLTTGEGRATSHFDGPIAAGGLARKTTFPSGIVATKDTKTDGKGTVTLPDGVVITLQEKPDPRFGMLAPLTTTTTKTPLGRQRSVEIGRTVTLSDPNDVLSATAISETSTVNGSAFTRSYDAVTKTWTFTTAEGRKITTKLDAAGRVVETTTAGLAPVSYGYDVKGRLASMTQGDRTTALGYDAAGWLGSATDPLLQTTLFGRDAVGRVTQMVRPDNKAVGLGYDAGGNPISVTPPAQPAHGFGYDKVDSLTSYSPPSAGFSPKDTTWSYNLDRQLTSMKRPDAQSVGYVYDTAGRLSLLTGPTGTRTHAYSATTGLLDSIAAPGVTLTFGHDGHLVTSLAWSGDVVGSVELAFDDRFQVTSETVNQSNAVTISHDLDGLITKAGDIIVTRNAQNALVVGTALDAVTDIYSYSTFGEMSGYQALVGATAVYENALDRDKLARITKKTETIGGVTTVYEYAYDLAGRLQTVKTGGQLTASYDYDANGNRLKETAPSGATSGTYDPQDRLLAYGAVTFTYTAAGEMATRVDSAKNETTTYSYDVFGNLAKVVLPNGDIVEYLADPTERRVRKKVNGVVERAWLYKDELRPIAELDANGNVVSRFVYALGRNVPDYMIKAGVKYRLITDQVGSVRLVVNAATGAVAQRVDYDAFGVVLQDTSPGFQPFGFAGGVYDPDTALVRFGARDYDPGTGRWTAKDPIGFAGSDTNLYAYTAGDPVNRTDPAGLFDPSGFLIGVGTAAKAGLGATLGAAAAAAVGVGAAAYNGYMLAEEWDWRYLVDGPEVPKVPDKPCDPPPPKPDNKCRLIRRVNQPFDPKCDACWYACPGWGGPVIFRQEKALGCPSVGGNGLVNTDEIGPQCR
jgi:RHS repeat-associated protein